MQAEILKRVGEAVEEYSEYRPKLLGFFVEDKQETVNDFSDNIMSIGMELKRKR